jgi:plastocyanin
MGSRRLPGRLARRPTVAVALALAAVLVIAVFAAGCGGSGSSSTTAGVGTTTAGSAGGGAEVVMKNLAFDPASVTIKVGETVKWTNQDSATHTVVADNGEFQSDNLAQGGTYTFTFSKAGTYPFHCSIHPSMKGTVIVQ